MPKYTLTDQERSTLVHALEVAAGKFADNVAMLKREQPTAFIGANGLKDLRELFTDYQVKTAELHERMFNARTVSFDDGEDTEEGGQHA